MTDVLMDKTISILLVEDNPGDVRLAQEASKTSEIINHLYAVEDGVEAMAFLRKEGKYADMPRPDLVILDLNLPKKDGRKVLAEVKADKDLKTIPVIVLTASELEQDINFSYQHYANCVINKPINFDQFSNTIKQIEDFWLTFVKLPQE